MNDLFVNKCLTLYRPLIAINGRLLPDGKAWSAVKKTATYPLNMTLPSSKEKKRVIYKSISFWDIYIYLAFTYNSFSVPFSFWLLKKLGHFINMFGMNFSEEYA